MSARITAVAPSTSPSTLAWSTGCVLSTLPGSEIAQMGVPLPR
jgi:hypothetical protein